MESIPWMSNDCFNKKVPFLAKMKGAGVLM